MIFRFFIKCWFAAVALSLVGPVAAAAADRAAVGLPVLTPAELEAAIAAPTVLAGKQRIDSTLQSNDALAVLDLLQQLDREPAVDSAGQAFLLHYTLMGLATVPESAAARRSVERFLNAPVAIRVWQHDGAYRLPIDAFDPAAAARFTLGRWNQAAWARRTRAELARGSTQFLLDWVAADRRAGGGLSPTGVAAALRSVEPAALLSLRQPLAIRMARGERVGPLATIVALRTADAELASAIVWHADTSDALGFLRDAAGTFDQDQRFELLTLAAQRNDLGSAAMYGLAELETGAAQQFLIEQFDSDSLGTSAAAALARNPSPALVRRFAEVVRGAPSMRARERAILALQLAPPVAGEAALASLATDPRVPVELQARIARHLP